MARILHQPSKIEDAYPLSPMQQGMLFHSLSSAPGVYIEQLLCQLQEVVDGAALRQAWAIVISRHPVLRTAFRWADLDQPQQQVEAHVQIPWEMRDWSGIPDAEQERRIAEYLEADRRRGFDLARAPLLRLAIFRCGEVKHHLIWTFHHALLDGRSLVLVLREAFSYYDAFRAGSELTLQMPRPYRDYIGWIQKQDFSKAEGFWRHGLGGFREPTPLMVDRLPNREWDSEIDAEELETRLPTEVTSQLRWLADENQLTVNTIVQGAWSLLLSRYSGESDVVFGVTRNCRRSTVEGAEAMIGVFINTLPIRIRVNPDAPLIPWLKELRSQSESIREHEHTPLEKVRRWSDLRAGKPLFESVLVFERLDLNSLLRREGPSWLARWFHLLQKTNYPLTLAAYGGDELCLKIAFDRQRVDDGSVQRMLGHLRTLLEGIAERPNQLVSNLSILTVGEQNQHLVEWNQTGRDYPTDLCVHELFEAQVERTPGAIAAEFEEQHLSYRELNNRSNQLAYVLRNLGVGPDVLVGLCLDRSLEMIVGLFGVLKAGGAYVPIDPTYPPSRITFMLNDINTRVILTQRRLLKTLPPLKATNVICLDDPEWVTSSRTVCNPGRKTNGLNIVYVNYTSGSTGTPKGVMISHRAIVNVMSWLQSAFPLDERDRVLQQISFSFDPSVLEILAPLFVGGRLVIAKPGGHRDPFYLVHAIIERQITILHLVPSALRMLLQIPELKVCQSLRHVFCGGDTLSEDLARSFFQTLSAELHYFYGPTEVGITSIYCSVPRGPLKEVIPIGRPVANTQAYVLDGHRRPVPIGVPGELYLGGVQVGLGYCNQPRLTEERFIVDPFNNVSGARLYKTGDLVRYLRDGNIQFLGRMDHQVKIRGHRIELGEIESIIRLHPSVEEAMAIVREDTPGDKRIAAYAKPADFSPGLVGELRSILQQRLPTYMVPSAIVLLSAFPVTPNGKVDRAALPSPDWRSSEAEPLQLYVPPQTAMEQVLASMWCELLKLRQVGIHDNFFELGGDSLMSVGMIGRINKTLSVNLGIPDLLQNPTVEKLAKLVSSEQASKRQGGIARLKPGNTAAPIYFIYAGPDEFRLAEFVGGSRAIFGIQMPWPLAWRDAVASNRTSDFPSMEQLISSYVTELSCHIGFESCVLAGHSFAGLMAFEVAHQLQRQGRDVEVVMLFDTWARYPTAREAAWEYCREQWRKGGERQSIGGRIGNSCRAVKWMLGEEVRKVRRAAPGQNGLSTTFDEQGMPLPWRFLEQLYTRIVKFYRPRRLDSRGILFRSVGPDQKNPQAADYSLGWKNLFARGFEIVPVPGDHMSMFRQGNQALGQKINEVLKRY